MNCLDCREWMRVPRFVRTMSCPACGCKYLIVDGAVTKFYPSLSMHPVTHVAPDGIGVLSMWMPGTTRPIRIGEYDCRFRHTEPNEVLLRWNGYTFTYNGQGVDMTHFLSWRGRLA